MRRVLVTGASGFIGRALIDELNSSGYKVKRLFRHASKDIKVDSYNDVVIENISYDIDIGDILTDIDTVVHLAARVHVMKKNEVNSLDDYRSINLYGTLNLARQAAKAGVKRFIFISTIKVNGEENVLGRPYTADDDPDPIDPYAVSKYEAELGLKKIAKDTNLEIVIIRPVLVYGPGVKGNFLNLLDWLYRGIPLPFGFVNNKRSFIALVNLVNLIVICIDNPAAKNETFLASDGVDLSTTELLKRMSIALDKPARLFPIPARIIKTLALLVGKRDTAQRLLGSLQVDITQTKKKLGWAPPISIDEGIKQTARWYLSNIKNA